MHKRKKRILQKKLRRIWTIEHNGIKFTLLQKIKKELHLKGVSINGTVLPVSKIKGFELSVNHPLPNLSDTDENIEKLYFPYPGPEVTVQFDVTDKDIEKLLNMSGVRQFTEETDDGLFRHTIICETEDYNILESQVIE